MFVALVITLALGAAADEPALTAEQRAALPRYFGFGPLQIYKLDAEIGLLRLADLDADGRRDVLVWNGRKSRFELFFQQDPGRPPAATAATLERNAVPDRGDLRRENIPVNYKVSAADVADVTGDARPDIIFFGEPRELVILPGLAEGGFGPPDSTRAPDGTPRSGALATGDFTGDGLVDVALLGADVLLLFPQKPGGGLAKPQRLVHGIKSPMLMMRIDANGDRRDDLIIGSDDDQYGLYVGLQDASGTLAYLRPLRMPRLRSQTVAPALDTAGGELLYAIELATGRLRQFRWQLTAERAGVGDWPLRLHSYPAKTTSKRRPLALGDVDGDGRVDCLSVDPDAAQLVLFRGGDAGLGVGTAFPGLAKTLDICIGDVDGDGRVEVLTASAEEKMIGVSSFADGRLTFPSPLKTSGAPFAVAVGSLKTGEPADRLAYVTRNEDEEFALRIAALGADPQESAITLEDLSDDPAGVRFADVNQDGRNDLLVFVRFAAPQVYLQGDGGTFSVFEGQESRDWLLKPTNPEGFAVADINADGRVEVLFAQDNLARAMVVREGRWEVVDQYNPESPDARIRGLAVLPGTERPTLVLYEQKAGELLVVKARPDNTYAVAQSMPVGSFELSAMEPLPVGAGGQAAVLLADPAKLAVLMPDDEEPTFVAQRSYESDVKDAFLADSVIGDVNHDGVRDVIAVDMAKAALEVLTTLPDGEFVRATRFQVFQGKRFADAPDTRGEPRDVLVGDVTGDKIDDVVLLVHDRLIVYPGQ